MDNKKLIYFITFGCLFGGSVFGQNTISKYPNGTMRDSGYVERNNKVGLWKTWYSDGKLNAIESYSEGKLDGKALYYSPNGKMIANETWFNGLQTDTNYYCPVLK